MAKKADSRLNHPNSECEKNGHEQTWLNHQIQSVRKMVHEQTFNGLALKDW